MANITCPQCGFVQPMESDSPSGRSTGLLLIIGWSLTVTALVLLGFAAATQYTEGARRIGFLIGLITLELGVIYYVGSHVVRRLTRQQPDQDVMSLCTICGRPLSDTTATARTASPSAER